MIETTTFGRLTVTRHGPGVYSISGAEQFTMQEAPRVVMALGQLRQAMVVEAWIAERGIPDLTRWRGALSAPTLPTPDPAEWP